MRFPHAPIPVLVGLGLLFAAPAASAATLHVATGGTDSAACTAAAPCASFNRAYQQSQPGDTIEVAGGNYGSQWVPPR
jgi:hypothetical protein